jgi:hypothetical protein
MKTSPRTLFIGDLHNCHTVGIEQLIDELEPDLTIFLGDYFDHFGDSPESAARMARWLAGSIEHDNRIHLIGNHDLPYMARGAVDCPGYTLQKAAYIAHELDLARWRERSRLFYWITPTLLASHAGVSLTWLQEQGLKPEQLHGWLEAEESRAWDTLSDPARPRIHPLLRVGSARTQGRTRGCGGLIWCDWDDEFIPVPGIGQILGHTPANGIRLKFGKYSTVNFCADTCDPRGGGPRQCLLWQHGQYEIIRLGGAYHDL